jgi:hypothetical protein
MHALRTSSVVIHVMQQYCITQKRVRRQGGDAVAARHMPATSNVITPLRVSSCGYQCCKQPKFDGSYDRSLYSRLSPRNAHEEFEHDALRKTGHQVAGRSQPQLCRLRRAAAARNMSSCVPLAEQCLGRCHLERGSSSTWSLLDSSR